MNVIKTSKKDLGDNFIVRRALPSVKKRMVGPFIFWDHMGPAPLKEDDQMLVRQHPHIGISTLTYLFSGTILHRDSLNNECLIKPGEVNWMTAGNGITHSERSRGTDTLEGIQLWIALPQQAEETPASFEHYEASDLPKFESGGIHHTLIAGSYQSMTSPVSIFSPLFYLQAYTSENAAQESYSFDKKHESAVYVAKGDISVKGQSLSAGSLAYFEPGETVHIEAQANSNFMIFGGQAFEEGRHIWWNFVASSKEKIEDAKQRWREQSFAKTMNEPENLFIPLPD